MSVNFISTEHSIERSRWPAQAPPGKAHMDGDGRSGQRAQQGFKPRPPGSQPPGHTGNHLAVTPSPAFPALHLPPQAKREADSLQVKERRLAKPIFFLYIQPSWRGARGLSPASSAPSHPTLSWPPDFPSCATSTLLPFLGRAQAWHHSRMA